MSDTVTTATCAKLCLASFAVGIAAGFILNKKARTGFENFQKKL
jgi:hypothetical protein